MLGVLALLVVTRVLLLVMNNDWFVYIVKLVLALLLLQLLGKMATVLPYS